MVNYGISPANNIDCNGNTPLHVAAIKDNLEVLDYLLAQDNIFVNVRNFKGETPLHQAVQNGRLESTKRLILARANVNLPNYHYVTPLHISVTCLGLAHLLVLHGAHIDAVDYLGNTPLHYAISKGCLDTVCMLLFFNVDANSTGCNNLTPFMKAIITKQIDIQRVLLEYVLDFNAVTADGMATLALAFVYHSPYVSEIIQRGADVNYVNMFLPGTAAWAFLLCLYNPNLQNFKLIWDRLSYDENINTIDLCILFDHLGLNDLEKYIDVIIESDNVKTAVASLTKNKNYFMFINEFFLNKLKLEQLINLTCRLILYGYQVTSYDIDEIFMNYGYCELFKILLYMENNYTYGWLPDMIVPRLIFDLDCKLSNVMAAVLDIDKRVVPRLLQYFNYPPLTNAFMHKYRDNEEITSFINKLPVVPLLTEMARDKAREHIAKTFKTKNACELYTIVNHLNISSVYKKILTFEKKLYNFTIVS